MASRSAALNPTSNPFFPGGGRNGDSDNGSTQNLGFAQATIHRHEQDRSSLSSLSLSPSEFRSVKSSPSPPSNDGDSTGAFSIRTPPVDHALPNPAFRHLDVAERQSQTNGSPRAQGMGNMGTRLHGMGEDVETPGPTVGGDARGAMNTSFFTLLQQQNVKERATPPISNHNLSSHSTSGVTSSSPGSSTGSHMASSIDLQPQNFESQLRASPFIHDLLDRLVRCEYSTREIQRDLGEVHRKVNLLVERSLAGSATPMNASQKPPEFRDPFSPTNKILRPSISNPPPPPPGDDITVISQRLNTLTSSVGQLLALQTQQLHANSQGPIGNSTPQLEMSAPPLNHGLVQNRPDLRTANRMPNGPMRTWSTGNLDLPVRGPPDLSGLGRLAPDLVPRDKRRSVSGMQRRDSAGMMSDAGNDYWGGNNGPIISKWDQLNLVPELLRSLSKFGLGPPNKIQQRALPFLLKGADIIAQAPPTQERIAAYVIPAIQVALTTLSSGRPGRGPVVILVSTTVDQATQAQRMIRDLGGPIGIRSALGVGASNGDASQEVRAMQQTMPHIVCGTPQKLHTLFTSATPLDGSEVRFLVIDEVDQLIARNLHESVLNIVKLMPSPKSRPPQGPGTPTAPGSNGGFTPSSEDIPLSRKFSLAGSASPTIERQTALFSNTVPQDVLNLATSIQLREPVRVLVRRDGGVTQGESVQSARGLRQYYLYLAFTATVRADTTSAAPGGGLGIIGSGRGSTATAETVQAREWKLDALADLLDDVELTHAIIHVGGMSAMESVMYKLASRGFEVIPLHGDMAAPNKLAALNKYRSAGSAMPRPVQVKVLVVYDVQIKDVPQVPLIVNYDLPKAVEEYAHRVAPAIAPNNYSRPGVVVNFVTATGGDVEMLRSIECFYKIKCPEVPMSLRDIV